MNAYGTKHSDRQIKFKIRQHLPRALLPNLMLTKVAHSIIVYKTHPQTLPHSQLFRVHYFLIAIEMWAACMGPG